MQIPNIFTSFSPKIFLTIFLVKSKLSTAKKSKTTTFSRVFHPKKIDNFLGKSKLNFWTKNEDFEQCEIIAQNLLCHPVYSPKKPLKSHLYCDPKLPFDDAKQLSELTLGVNNNKKVLRLWRHVDFSSLTGYNKSVEVLSSFWIFFFSTYEIQSNLCDFQK